MHEDSNDWSQAAGSCITPSSSKLTRVIPGHRRRIGAAAWFGALATVALAYSPLASNRYFWLDESQILQGAIIARSWREVAALFTGGLTYEGYYRPLWALTHSLDVAVWRLEPRWHLLGSLALHMLNVVLAGAVAKRAGWSTASAAALAALWGLHPVNTAAVGLLHFRADRFLYLPSLVFVGAVVQALGLLAAGAMRPGLDRSPFSARTASTSAT